MASNASLVIFRILFGLLMVLESWGAIATGWVRTSYVEPKLTFPVGGFVQLRVLSGELMYGYFAVMGFAALGVMLGFRYRLSSLALAVLWTGAYLGQTDHYNNHYYLAVLFAWGMALLPAAGRASMDVAAGRLEYTAHTNPWVARAFRLQLLIVFSYAAIAKLYPGWLNGDYLGVNLGSKGDVWPLGWLVVQEWFQDLTIWGAILFDAAVIPALWWRRTRVAAFWGLVAFNLFNSLVFRIGIFPYMVIGLTVFFFSEKSVERAFAWVPGMKPSGSPPPEPTPSPAPTWKLGLLGLYLAVQVALPLRHHLYPGDVTWTEEGHRMSWRMMLRTKSATLLLVATDPATGKSTIIDQDEFLNELQQRRVASAPDFLYRFVQDLKAHYRDQGREGTQIFARYSACSLNGTPAAPLYDGAVDLAQVTWKRFARNEWVLDQRRF
jgi:hypothetical protein